MPYVVFEGNDGAGKTTTMQAVATALQTAIGHTIPFQLTHHPGSTPLGAHIRRLVKYPESLTSPTEPPITIDNLSRQILYMVDTVSFIRQRLEPALARGELVFADRSSFISALVYGTAEGLALTDIDRLFQLITPPKMDRLYVLRCPWQVGRERLAKKNEQRDHFERKPHQFFRAVEDIYDNLLTGPAERLLLVSRSANPRDVVYIDSSAPFDKVVETIVADLAQLLKAQEATEPPADGGSDVAQPYL